MVSARRSLEIATILVLAYAASATEATGQQRESPGRRGARFQPLVSESVGINAIQVAAVLPGAGFSLSIEGDFKLGGHVFKASSYYPGDYPFLHNEGLANTALGLYGLMNVTPDSPAPGDGSSNTALGQAALYSTTSGGRNTAVGVAALYPNTDGSQNTAVGWWAMASYTPSGDRNTAIGAFAGYYTDGRDNILVGSSGVAGESNTLRIGEATGTGSFQLEAAYIHGVRNAMLGGSDEQAVCVDDKNQLGPCSPSSARFKQDVEEMGEASRALFTLRPVVFRYKPTLKRGDNAREFGLVAEEVAAVFPELVSYDEAGEPFSVRYQVLSTLLLNEVQRLDRKARLQSWLLGGVLLLGLGLGVTRWRFP